MPYKTLIIKLGAIGDVIRTTPLLRVLPGETYWITKRESFTVLPTYLIKKVLDIEKADTLLNGEKFDLVLSLDDDYEAAEFATKVRKKSLVGTFIDQNGKIQYTDSSAEWFDMGLISRYGKHEADKRKFRNTKSWQEILFNMAGKKFSGEEYILNYERNAAPENSKKCLLGMEDRSGDRWPAKRWNKYDELAEVLRSEKVEVFFFRQRESILDYIKDIDQCDIVVTGDTLALHIAIALKKKVIALFTCTSPAEIYDYARTIKIVSPLLERAFYKTEYTFEAVDAISLQDVYKNIKRIATVFP